MDRNFARSLSLVRKDEGGWVDNPKDPGGATMKGVTLANFRRFVKSNGTKADLRKITDAQVSTVFRRQYWDTAGGAELPDGVDYAVFDFSINSGPTRAVKALQKVIGVKQDGRVGPATLKAARANPLAKVINDLCDERLAFMKRAKGSEGQLKGKLLWPTFGGGWSKRVKSVRSEALAMAARPTPDKPSIVTKEVEKKVPVEVPVPVKAKDLEKPWYRDLMGQKELVSTAAIPGISAITGAAWQTVAVIGVFCIIGALAFYIIRKRDAAKQEAQVQAIHADAAEVKAAI